MADIISEENAVEENSQSFVFYESFYQGLSELEPEEELKFYRAIARYGLYREEPDFKGIYKSYWIQIKTSIASAKKRYESSIKNGSKGGAPIKNDNASKGKTCRKCTHRKSCDFSGKVDAEICNYFEYPKTSQNNPEQPRTTQNYLNVNDNVNVNKNDNKNVNNNSFPFNIDFTGAEKAFDTEIAPAIDY